MRTMLVMLFAACCSVGYATTDTTFDIRSSRYKGTFTINFGTPPHEKAVLIIKDSAGEVIFHSHGNQLSALEDFRYPVGVLSGTFKLILKQEDKTTEQVFQL